MGRWFVCAAAVMCGATVASGPAQAANARFSLIYLTSEQAIYMDLQHQNVSGGIRTVTIRKIWSSQVGDDQMKVDNVLETSDYDCGSSMVKLDTMAGYMGTQVVFPDPGGATEELHTVPGDDIREQKMLHAVCGSVLQKLETTDEPYVDAHRRWAK